MQPTREQFVDRLPTLQSIHEFGKGYMEELWQKVTTPPIAPNEFLTIMEASMHLPFLCLPKVIVRYNPNIFEGNIDTLFYSYEDIGEFKEMFKEEYLEDFKELGLELEWLCDDALTDGLEWFREKVEQALDLTKVD